MESDLKAGVRSRGREVVWLREERLVELEEVLLVVVVEDDILIVV
jgi:hypothetical protein